MANMTFKTNLLPQSNNAYELGSSTAGWRIAKLNIPISSGTTSIGPGENGQVLRTNGNNIYWGTIADTDTWIAASTTTAGYISALSGSATHYLAGNGSWQNIPVRSVAAKTGDVVLGDLIIGNKTYNGSTATTIEIADLGLASATQFLGITTTELVDGDTTATINIAVGPVTGEVTNFVNGDIVMRQDTGDEFIWTGDQWSFMGLASSWALANHVHGNILNNGTITSDTEVTNGQHLVITDSNNLIGRSSLAFGTDDTLYLRNDGDWQPITYAASAGYATTAAYATDTTKVAKAGDTMTGSLTFGDADIGIKRVGRSSNWYNGRDKALLCTTSLNGYSALTSVKTNNGSWDMGAWTNQADDLIFSYITDANYSSATNQQTAVIRFLENGHIVGNLDGTATTAGRAVHAASAAYAANANTCSEIKAGTASRMAYYSGATAISSAGNIVTNGSYIHIYNTADAAGNTASTSVPFLIGSPTGVHLVIDNNEILPKTSATTGGTLYLGDQNAAIQVAGSGGFRVANGRVCIGARTSWNTGEAGIWLNTNGTMHLGGATPEIGFHKASASANTSFIQEIASGTLRLGERLVINHNSNVVTYGGASTGTFVLYVNGAIGGGEIWGSGPIRSLRNVTAVGNQTFMQFSNQAVQYGQIRYIVGTATTEGACDLLLGNGTAKGTAKNATGRIYLYNPDGGNTRLLGAHGTLGGTEREILNLQYVQATQVWGAVWNDYAEMRQTVSSVSPGYCIKEIGNGQMELANRRLERGCKIISDTYGFAIGQTDECQTPIAVAGRVLAYPYEDKEFLRQHIGWPVCSGPSGTVSVMTEEEEMKYPSRIVGTISEIPDYEIWHAGDQKDEPQDIKVNGRIWIYVK